VPGIRTFLIIPQLLGALHLWPGNISCLATSFYRQPARKPPLALGPEMVMIAKNFGRRPIAHAG
jgi:hypothetical protein